MASAAPAPPSPDRRRRFEIGRVAAAAANETRVHVLELLAGRAWQTNQELQAQIGVAQSVVSRTVSSMVNAGLVERRGGKRGTWLAITEGGWLLLEVAKILATEEPLPGQDRTSFSTALEASSVDGPPRRPLWRLAR